MFFLLTGRGTALDSTPYSSAGFRDLMRHSSDKRFHEYIAFLISSPEGLIGKFTYSSLNDDVEDDEDYIIIETHLSLNDVRKKGRNKNKETVVKIFDEKQGTSIDTD